MKTLNFTKVLFLVTALIDFLMRNNSLRVQMNEFNSPPELLCLTSNSKEEEKSLSTDPPAEGLPFSNDHGSVFLWIKMCAGFYRSMYSVGKKCSLLMLLCFNRHNSD